ncbi:MAG: hypothetical protein PGN26_11035 [Xylophilus ampelinus]
MNDSSTPEISAKERLELNRQALIDQFAARGGKKARRAPVSARVQMIEGRRVAVPNPSVAADAVADDAVRAARGAAERADAYLSDPDSSRPASGSVSAFLPIAKHMARTWWEYHPARALLSMGRPFLEDYVERRPWKAVAVAAGVGATLVVVRPWKLLSVGGIVVAAMKSSQVSSIALSLISAAQSSAEIARQNLRSAEATAPHPADGGPAPHR